MQKLDLVPLEQWEKRKDPKIQVKEVTVSQAAQKVVNFNPQKKKNLQMNQKGKGKIVQKKEKKKKKEEEEEEKEKIILANYKNLKQESRAMSLMRYIKRNEDIVKSKNGKFQYKNKVIPNSSIKKLIFHATSDDQTKPHGMKLFYQALSYANVPTFLIVNKIGKSIMKKTRNKKEDKWRPLGILDRKN